MRPVLAKDIRNLNQLTIKASDPDSQANALPPVLEPQQKILLDDDGPRKGCRRVSSNCEGHRNFMSEAGELSEDLKGDQQSYTCQNFQQNKNFSQMLRETGDLHGVVNLRSTLEEKKARLFVQLEQMQTSEE